MDYKEFWIDTYNDLEAELEREPTSDEIESELQWRMQSIRDCYEES
jgi:hypothetical protein